MNARDLFLNTLNFKTVNRIPFMPGSPRESTLKTWHTQGLAQGADYYTELCSILNIDPGEAKPDFVKPPVSFIMIPQFEEKVMERKNGHLVVQDWKGNICEISDRYDVTYLRTARDFVTRKWIKCPVESRADWDQMKTRYRPDDPDRFAEDFNDWVKKNAPSDNRIIQISFNGPFWQLREWLGFENLCIKFIDDPDLIHEMITFWTDFISDVLTLLLKKIRVDYTVICEDMAYKTRSMISSDMARTFLKPAYDRWVKKLKAGGCTIIDMDSDGYIGDLIPIWIDSGITTCDPLEVAAGCDINQFRKRFNHDISFRMGVDKRLMAKGGQYIKDEIRRLSPVIRDGGYIPGCDHGVPPDISWSNFVDYAGLLAKECGWA
jgi:uroporphyrinogen decarboxylase